jgi:hypothetical protein
MSYHYAQIDETTGNVVSDSWLSGEVNLPNMIRIPDNLSVIGKRYNFETKEFEELPPPPPAPEPEPGETVEDAVDMLVAESLEQAATIEEMQGTIESMQNDIDTLVINSLEPEGE